MAELDDDYRIPPASYRDDPKRADSYVHIELNIPGVKKSLMGNKASNAIIVLEAKEMSFTVSITLQARGNSTKYHYVINKLPHAINTDSKMTYYQVRKNIVDVYLAKEKPARWDNILTSVGLEQQN